MAMETIAEKLRNNTRAVLDAMRLRRSLHERPPGTGPRTSRLCDELSAFLRLTQNASQCVSYHAGWSGLLDRLQIPDQNPRRDLIRIAVTSVNSHTLPREYMIRMVISGSRSDCGSCTKFVTSSPCSWTNSKITAQLFLSR